MRLCKSDFQYLVAINVKPDESLDISGLYIYAFTLTLHLVVYYYGVRGKLSG